MADDARNVDQQKLSDIVKGLHSRLRKQLRKGENVIIKADLCSNLISYPLRELEASTQ